MTTSATSAAPSAARSAPTLPAPLSLNAAPAHALGDVPAVFARIDDPAVNIAVWHRPAPGHDPALVGAWARQIGRREWLFDSLSEPDLGLARFDPSGALDDLAPGPDRAFLHEDLSGLIARFRTLLLAPGGLFEPSAAVRPGRHVLVRLAGITDDACRKFHSDRVSLRLITTYLGPGTEWLPEGHVWRVEPRELPACVASANAQIAPHPEHIQRNDPGDVAILKGLTHPHVLAGRVPALVHRSPPIGGTPIVRLVLAITADAGESP